MIVTNDRETKGIYLHRAVAALAFAYSFYRSAFGIINTKQWVNHPSQLTACRD